MGALWEFHESQVHNSFILYGRKCSIHKFNEILSTDSMTKTLASKQEQVNSTGSFPPSASFKLTENNFSWMDLASLKIFIWN